MMINYLLSSFVESLGKSFLLLSPSIQLKRTLRAYFKTTHITKKAHFQNNQTIMEVNMRISARDNPVLQI